MQSWPRIAGELYVGIGTAIKEGHSGLKVNTTQRMYSRQDTPTVRKESFCVFAEAQPGRLNAMLVRHSASRWLSDSRRQG